MSVGKNYFYDDGEKLFLWWNVKILSLWNVCGSNWSWRNVVPVHLADDDHAIEEVDVAVREPFPILNQNVQLSLCKENKAMFFFPIQSNLKIQNIKK